MEGEIRVDLMDLGISVCVVDGYLYSPFFIELCIGRLVCNSQTLLSAIATVYICQDLLNCQDL